MSQAQIVVKNNVDVTMSVFGASFFGKLSFDIYGKDLTLRLSERDVADITRVERLDVNGRDIVVGQFIKHDVFMFIIRFNNGEEILVDLTNDTKTAEAMFKQSVTYHLSTWEIIDDTLNPIESF